jgi:hypothetical protein
MINSIKNYLKRRYHRKSQYTLEEITVGSRWSFDDKTYVVDKISKTHVYLIVSLARPGERTGVEYNMGKNIFLEWVKFNGGTKISD